MSGTGALRVAGEFLNRFGARAAGGGALPLLVPTPTWGNHHPVFGDAGLAVQPYRYYDAASCGLDFAGMLADLEAAPAGSIVLLHACAHNPTGVDPTPEQWHDISAALRAKGHFVLLDMAYQGFASGDPARDAHALHKLVADGHSLMLCQSFAKNFGLYGERAGLWSMVCRDQDERDRVQSQVKKLIRPMYSNPPLYGARLVSTVLGDGELDSLWRSEVQGMAGRIIDMRVALTKHLKEAGSTKDWSHIEKQIGMFCYSGLKPEQVDTLRNDWSIYMTRVRLPPRRNARALAHAPRAGWSHKHGRRHDGQRQATCRSNSPRHKINDCLGSHSQKSSNQIDCAAIIIALRTFALHHAAPAKCFAARW